MISIKLDSLRNLVSLDDLAAYLILASRLMVFYFKLQPRIKMSELVVYYIETYSFDSYSFPFTLFSAFLAHFCIISLLFYIISNFR